MFGLISSAVKTFIEARRQTDSNIYRVAKTCEKIRKYSEQICTIRTFFFERKLYFSFLKTLFRMQKISYLLNFKEFFYSEMSQKKCISRLFKNPYKKYVQTVKFQGYKNIRTIGTFWPPCIYIKIVIDMKLRKTYQPELSTSVEADLYPTLFLLRDKEDSRFKRRGLYLDKQV